MAFFCNDSSLEFSVSVYIVTCCISSLVYHATIPKNIHSRHIVPAVLLLHSLVLVSMLLNASLPKFFTFVEATVFGVCDPLLFCHVKGERFYVSRDLCRRRDLIANHLNIYSFQLSITRKMQLKYISSGMKLLRNNSFKIFIFFFKTVMYSDIFSFKVLTELYTKARLNQRTLSLKQLNMLVSISSMCYWPSQMVTNK